MLVILQRSAAATLTILGRIIAELLRYGLIRASFVPPKGQMELRELTHMRSTFVKERATLVNQLHKVLESANIKLISVASDVNDISGKAISHAMIAGGSTPEEMAELAQGRLRKKRDLLSRSLQGYVKPHHRFVLTELLCQIDSLEETIVRFDQEIADYCRPFEEAVVLLVTIPGVARVTAEAIVAEIGTDMSRFPTADHLASWAGVAPGYHESAGKRHSGRELVKNEPVFRAYRDFFWSVGVDPTKTRPASEALIRRILSVGKLPGINTAVDAYNLASVRTGIPIAAFDAGTLTGDLTLRFARDGELFFGIGMEKPAVLHPNQVIMTDAEQIIAIYPYRDSDSTKVTPESRNIRIITCGVPNIDRERLIEAFDLCAGYLKRYAGGTSERVEVFPPK